MWQYPTMLPLLYTWGPVVRKLMDGAGNAVNFLRIDIIWILSYINRTIDLMIPGLVLGPEGVLPNLNTGDLVAITIKGYSCVFNIEVFIRV